MSESSTPAPQTRPLRRTALFQLHQDLGAKFIQFHGWELPLQFSGILKEHEAVRTAAGLFDVSHMGQYVIEGPPAFAFIQRSIVSDLYKAKPGKALYTHIVNDQGGVVDDVIVYCLGQQRYFMVVNAANTDKDYDHLKRLGAGEDLIFENASDLYGMLAVQGPKAPEIVGALIPEAVQLPHFGVLEKEYYARTCLFARTGYTGEDGFEIIAPQEVIPRFWQDVVAKGRGLGLVPCGLGARDTLRLEAGLPLYGHELDEEHTSLEAGMQWLVALDGPVFAGREVLLRQAKEGVKRKLKGFKLLDPGVPRPGCKVFLEGKEVGTLTSATFSPTLKAGIGVGYMASHEELFDGCPVTVQVHDKQLRAMVYPLPFYRRKGAPAHK